MKMVLFEIQRVLRARLLSLIVVFVTASAIAYAINEVGPRYAGASQLSLNLGEIARTSTSISSSASDFCAECTPPEAAQVIAAVQFAIDTTAFWEQVAQDVLDENGGEMPVLPIRFGELESQRALATVGVVAGTESMEDPVEQLARGLRSVVSIDFERDTGELLITLHRADRETTILVFRSLDFEVRSFIVGEITQQLRRELASNEAEIALVRDFETGRSAARAIGVLDAQNGVASAGEFGDLASVIPALRSSSANLRSVLHLDAIARGEPADVVILGRASADLLPELRNAIDSYVTGTSSDAALREAIEERRRDIAALRESLAADVAERRAEASLLFDELRTRSSVAAADVAIARQELDAALNAARLTRQIDALRATINRAEAAILSTSRFAQFQYGSGARSSVLIGLLISLIYFLWSLTRQFGVRTITSPAEVRDLSLPVLGEVPAQDSFSVPIASEGEARDNLVMARAMRNIRSAILATSAASEHLSILVTSSEMDEGKSFIARELAWAFSTLENRRVLLIAADYRRIVPMGGLTKQPKHTLADLMLGTNPDDEIDLLVPELGFEYLPARPIDLDPSDLLSSPRYDQLMEKLRQEFDVIVIDGPPVLPVSDSVNLARCADITVFAIRHNTTLVSRVIEGLTRLRMAGIKPIAAVLSRKTGEDDDHDGYLAYIRGNHGD